MNGQASVAAVDETALDVRPHRTLWLLSIAHAVNHAQAVLLPLIFLKIIDEFHTTEGSVAILAPSGRSRPAPSS
jgi:hypothetical protein